MCIRDSVNRPYNELKGHGLILDYYGIFDHLNEALNYKPDELGDVAFPFEAIRDRSVSYTHLTLPTSDLV